MASLGYMKPFPNSPTFKKRPHGWGCGSQESTCLVCTKL